MLRQIKFTDNKSFNEKDDNNLMDILTSNTIILCENDFVKLAICKEIMDILINKEECKSEYYIEENDKLNFHVYLDYLPTTELVIDNEQRITITMEAPYILSVTDTRDIWFASVDKNNLISVYPMRVFKGYEEKWNEGVRAVYKYVVNGRYGAYLRYANIVENK